MSTISQYLNQIRNSVYGRDMRSAIYNAIDKTFGSADTYTDQYIFTGAVLTENRTKVKFFVPLHNATERDISINPRSLVVRRDSGWYISLGSTATYTYDYQINGINITAIIDHSLDGFEDDSCVAVVFDYDVTLG